MNFHMIKSIKSGMRLLVISLLAAGSLGTWFSARPMAAQTLAGASNLVVHEWGTFTSVAGHDGQAVEWAPLSLPPELPEFVERNIGFGAFKVGLRGTVRMETPVLYFYSRQSQTVSVHVDFARGLITEWYPRASFTFDWEAARTRYQKHGDGGITWDSVILEPEAAAGFPSDPRDANNHYYAARATAAAPLRVHTARGDQRERFLFYRGVSAFPVPFTATLNAHNDLVVNNPGPDEITDVVLFERRGDRVGYSIAHGLQKEMVMPSPELTSSVVSLYSELEQVLESRGLYQDEAHAMVQTWSKSWFEEGSRLFYIVPASFVNAILPLKIDPAPAQTVRVFVGRIELITPATQKAVQSALATNDQATLAKYSRFLEAILETIKNKKPQLSSELQSPGNSPCDADTTLSVRGGKAFKK